MKKSTKVIATIVAVVLVVTAMVVAIYAATAGNVGINANVSWTAQEGVNLEFWATATGGDQEKSVERKTIAPTTTNADAKIQGDLSCSFKDDSDDGVNNPGAITFKYYVKNNSLTPLNIRVTKTPEAGAESGTSASDHKPKVVLISTIGSNSVIANVLSTSGCELKAGETFGYSVELSMASGGTASIDANTGLMKDFDAGVDFLFNVGNETNGNIITQIDSSSPVTVASSTVSGQTLGEYLSTIEPEYCSGWFFDEELTKAVTEQNLNASLRDSASASLYTKTASTTGLTFTLSDDGNSYLVAGESSTSPSGEVVIPSKYNGKPVSGFVQGTATSIAFKRNENITGIVFPNSLTTIGRHVFSYCEGLTSISIPDSVTKIDCYTFFHCSNLTRIKIASSNINYDSRNNCNAIIESASNKLIAGCKTTIIPNTVTIIGNSSFESCTGLTSIIIPNSVISIDVYAFSGCNNLTSVTLSNGIRNLAVSAFNSCKSLNKIYIPASVTTISAPNSSNPPFYGCSSTLKIYCEASSKPNGWGTYWNYYNATNPLSVTWGVTRAEFDAL